MTFFRIVSGQTGMVPFLRIEGEYVRGLAALSS
jgi:hypothetical protein